MKNLFIIVVLCLGTVAQAKILKIYQPKSGLYLNQEALIQLLPNNGHIVFGEFHYHPPIQQAQAEVMAKKVQFDYSRGDYALHWEFLNHTDQSYINEKFNEYIANLITVDEFLTATLGENSLTYREIIKTLKKSHGHLFGVNLPRKLKQKVIQGGIRAIDAKYIPQNFVLGGERYRERFDNIMRNHVPPEKIEAYFVAQSLTDSVMANQVAAFSQTQLNFIIAGSFHTDFYDGMVPQLNQLTGKNATTLKFVSRSLNTSAEIESYLKYDPKYGYYADYIIITD